MSDRFPPDSIGRRWAMVRILEGPDSVGDCTIGDVVGGVSMDEGALYDVPEQPPTLAEIVERLAEDGEGVERWAVWKGRYMGAGADDHYHYTRMLREHPQWADIPQPGYRLTPREPEPVVSGFAECVIAIISDSYHTDTDLAAIADAVNDAQEAKP